MNEYSKRDLVLLSSFFGVCFLFSGIARTFMPNMKTEINILITITGLCLITLALIFDVAINTSKVKEGKDD